VAGARVSLVADNAPGARVAVVTGGSRGIGRAIALRLAQDGHAVVVNFRADAAQAAEVVSAITEAGQRAVAVRADVTDPAELVGLFDVAEEQFGGLDVWVNNAGSYFTGPLATTTDEDFERVFALNTLATFRALREAANRVRDGGRIVQISSGMTVLPQPGGGLFAASKAAAEQLARALAHEVGHRGVTVNSVLAGPVRTEHSVLPAQVVEQLAARTPLRRRATPEDVADVVAFLSSPAGGWLTAQAVHASGGLF
jgi:3-oxoacyl-[acyl-carrier protein] reductase